MLLLSETHEMARMVVHSVRKDLMDPNEVFFFDRCFSVWPCMRSQISEEEN